MQIAIAENSRVALDQDEYEKRYAELTARYEKSKAKYDDIAEQIESKKAKRELFKGFIRTLEKQDGITYEFDAAWILGNVTRIPRHELPQTLDFSDFLPLFT